MVDVARTFTIPRPVDEVVDYLKDFAHAVHWDPGTLQCTRTSTGPVREGSRWRNVSVFRGRRTELVYELTRWEPRRLTFVGTNKTATSTDDLTFAPCGDDGAATEVTYRAHVRFHGLARLADPFLRREFERLGDELVVTMPLAVAAARD
ncbi:SRPBCC family protein [Yinghuangia soli]|uniref:SRPBCC family protein n=1 Tax=Yinghuangia soli TaxID=2908204 RepID=A0AA41QAJ6_9ACTN|nr:SRPBCC family protein [Yinghuangia soli]MCF2533930.1 SRPBCC family protein [Yinghuangia soli]